MRGGAINYFPLQDSIENADDLERNVHFINVVGHGNLTGQVFMVPENTYILFMGAAGFPIFRRPFQLPSLRNYRFLNTGETPAQWYQRTYAAIRDRTFFRDMLFKNNAPYAPDTTAIYEPGDIIQDLTLTFVNPNPPYLLMGVWNCPIPAELGDTFESINGTIRVAGEDVDELKHELSREQYKKGQGIIRGLQLPPQEKIELQQKIDELSVKIEKIEGIQNRESIRGRALQDTLAREPNNKVIAMSLDDATGSSLSEVIKKLGNAFDDSKPIRFIVVEACRSIGGPGMNTVADEALDSAISRSLIMRLMKNNQEGKNIEREVLALVKAYEQRAQQRRRASLSVRRTNSAAAAAAEAAAGGGGGGGGAAAGGGGGAPTVYITPSFRFTVQDLERVADKVPNGQLFLEQLMGNNTVSLDELETALEDYIRPSHNLITADVKRLVSGLMPQHQFSPRELVTYFEGPFHTQTAIIVEPISDEGYIKYRVLMHEGYSRILDTTVEPTSLRKGFKQFDKERLDEILLETGVDSNAVIDAAEASTVARLEEARAEEREFAAGLQPYKVKNTLSSGGSRKTRRRAKRRANRKTRHR
jgi:hypothetical protein